MPTLKQLIQSERPVIAPSIYDGISALVAKELGFKAAYIGSYATGATKYGLPDIGYITVDDMADQVRRLGPVVEVPIIADAEGGWGNPLHVARSIKILERAGAAAIHLEDHEFGKHITPKPRVITTAAFVDKLKAALDARTSEDFLIIARTDSPGIEGPEAAVDRALAYQEAGADGLFIAGFLDNAASARLRANVHVPMVSVDWPGMSAADMAAQGASIILYYALGHMAAQSGLRHAYSILAETGSAQALEAEWGGFAGIQAFDEFLGIERARAAAKRYHLLED